VPSGADRRPPHGPPPWQFVVRAAFVVTGLTLLVIVEVHGVGFYFAWGLIGLALVSEAAATLVYRHRARHMNRS
jgi:hypothetical protein